MLRNGNRRKIVCHVRESALLVMTDISNFRVKK